MHNGMTLTRIQGQGHRDPNALVEVDHQSPYGTNFYKFWPPIISLKSFKPRHFRFRVRRSTCACV